MLVNCISTPKTFLELDVKELKFSSEFTLFRYIDEVFYYRGTFDGREVAVKRVVSDQLKLTSREVELLRKRLDNCGFTKIGHLK